MATVIDAEMILAQRQIVLAGKNSGDLMLEAAYLGLINVMRAFESNQYRIDYVNGFGEGLLHFACKGSQDAMVDYLLKRGLDPNTQNNFKETPIFIATEMGAKQALHTLYRDKRTKLDHSDKFGDTILHFAARDGQLEVLEYILEQSTKLINRENQEGKTPLHLAQEYGHSTCAQLLRDYNAQDKCGNRKLLIKALAEQLVNEPADFKRSLISK